METRLREKISNEPITEEMVNGLFVEDLRVLRNEIYARRGRIFKDKELQKYFEAQAWYRPNPDLRTICWAKPNQKILAVMRGRKVFGQQDRWSGGW